MPKTLRLILGDQLNASHSWYDSIDEEVTYCMMEMRQETDYAKHHIQKVIAFFLSMRSFAKELERAGHSVVYLHLDDVGNRQSLTENLLFLIDKYEIEKFEYQLPDEYRLDQQLSSFCQDLDIYSDVFDTEHFFTTRGELATFFKGKKTYIMESFYRSMRKKHQIMMDGKGPITGQWNYDKDNREKPDKKHTFKKPRLHIKDVTEIEQLLVKQKVKTIGRVAPDGFSWPTTRKESLEVLSYFCRELLPLFGTYQDAMVEQSWSLYHSRVSFSMNAKMISPREVIKAAISEWESRPNEISINQIEGFVRQILGWREYMRGIYWAHMPSFAEKNFLEHTRKLPSWYWSGHTKMNCLKQSINQSLDHAYAHHIQRLMVTGNFALLAGIDPDEVDQWYLGIYIDAIEWVEITNTRGMSQFADGGIVGTKPYVSSANYIHKMSNYCNGCYYDRKLKTGDRACPFNSLYWNFYDRHREKFKTNARIGMMYRIWDKMESAQKEAILSQAEEYLQDIDNL